LGLFQENDLSPYIRNVKDFWTGIIYVAFGSAVIFIAREYGMGTGIKMGPAYFPTILSLLLILIGIISLIRSFIQPGTPISALTFRGLFLVIGSTLLFGLIVRGAGLVIALPVLVIVSSYASIQFRWKAALALAAALTFSCILIFLKGLGVPLPVVGSWFGG
jgi:putative tricarboxylic transport membrane protein